MRETGVFCCVNELTFGTYLRIGVATFSPIPYQPPPQRGKGARDWVQSPMSNDRINQASNQAFIKTKRTRVSRGSSSVNMWRFGEWSSERSWKLLAPFFTPCPMHLFHLAIPELHPFRIKWQFVSKMFLCALRATLAYELNPKRGSWEPLFYSLSVNILDFWLVSEVEGSPVEMSPDKRKILIP